MPPRRQLPWATKTGGGGKKANAKPPPARQAVTSDIDDDFFFGTVLQDSRRRNKRVVDQHSDDEPLGLSSDFAPSPRRGRGTRQGSRSPLSSPPPIAADLPPPTTEYMLTGVDKFDLRDDEWMMVEDELLQTAKLYTQHLHLAEYEDLKTKMEQLKKEAVARAVVPDAKPSVEGRFKRKAQVQEKKQKKALREVILAQGSSSEDEQPAVSSKSSSSFPAARSSVAGRVSTMPKPSRAHETVSDSDDLDAPKEMVMKRSYTAQRQPPTTEPAAEASMEPAMPPKPRGKPARAPRRNLWDEWDEMTNDPTPEPSLSRLPPRVPSTTRTVDPSASLLSPPSAMAHHTPLAKQSASKIKVAPRESMATSGNEPNDFTPARTPRAKDTADRLAKRKAERDREEQKKQKYDDIPTFLF